MKLEVGASCSCGGEITEETVLQKEVGKSRIYACPHCERPLGVWGTLEDLQTYEASRASGARPGAQDVESL